MESFTYRHVPTERSTFFPSFYTDQVTFIGVSMVTCAVGQILFTFVVWRGFWKHIPLLYWFPDKITEKRLILTLIAICVQLCVASGILAVVLPKYVIVETRH